MSGATRSMAAGPIAASAGSRRSPAAPRGHDPVRRVHDERALDALLAEPAGGGWRTVRKAGVRLDNADYIAGELGLLVGERVGIRRDPADPDRIFVYREDGTFICVAEDPGRTGADRAAIAARMTANYKASRKLRPAQATRSRGISGPATRWTGSRPAPGARPAGSSPRQSYGKGLQTPAPRKPGARFLKAADKADKAAASPKSSVTSASLAAAGALFLKHEE